MSFQWALYLHTKHAYFTIFVSNVKLQSKQVILPYYINTVVSVSEKLTWLGIECHSYKCHSKVIVYSKLRDLLDDHTELSPTGPWLDKSNLYLGGDS